MSRRIDASPPSSIAPLTIERGLKDIEAAEGDEVTFEVQLSKPNPQGRWLRDGKVISQDKKFVILTFQLPSQTHVSSIFSTALFVDKSIYRLKLRDIALKDKCVITFECADLKETSKLNVVQCKENETDGVHSRTDRLSRR